MNTRSLSFTVAVLCSLSLSTQRVTAQGSLLPPGPPTPTMKTLDQIEPRTLINHLPYTISQPGSYYLTTNLTANPGGIGIWASGVTLDLMGFELDGSGGSAAGIAVAPGVANICIRNGTVRNWNMDGINLSTATNCLLQDLRVWGNFGSGLVVGNASVVRGCVSSLNSGNGIVCGKAGVVSSCTADFNKGYGITGGDACSILGCVVFTNSSHGINIGIAGVVRDCSATANALIGVVSGEGSTIQESSAVRNGSHGIRTGPGSSVTGCSAYWNKGHGITDYTGVLGAPGLSVARCTATYNDQDGIFVSNGSTVMNCLAKGNKLNGIEGFYGSNATDCSANDNHGTGIAFEAQCIIRGCTASGNSTNGIQVTKQCSVVECTASQNGGHGIYVTENSNRLDSNTTRDNQKDGISIISTATRNVVVRNISSGNLFFQYRVPGIPGQPPAGANVAGPIATDATTANAWANFSP